MCMYTMYTMFVCVLRDTLVESGQHIFLISTNYANHLSALRFKLMT